MGNEQTVEVDENVLPVSSIPSEDEFREWYEKIADYQQRGVLPAHSTDSYWCSVADQIYYGMKYFLESFPPPCDPTMGQVKDAMRDRFADIDDVLMKLEDQPCSVSRWIKVVEILTEAIRRSEQKDDILFYYAKCLPKGIGLLKENPHAEEEHKNAMVVAMQKLMLEFCTALHVDEIDLPTTNDFLVNVPGFLKKAKGKHGETFVRGIIFPVEPNGCEGYNRRMFDYVEQYLALCLTQQIQQIPDCFPAKLFFGKWFLRFQMKLVSMLGKIDMSNIEGLADFPRKNRELIRRVDEIMNDQQTRDAWNKLSQEEDQLKSLLRDEREIRDRTVEEKLEKISRDKNAIKLRLEEVGLSLEKIGIQTELQVEGVCAEVGVMTKGVVEKKRVSAGGESSLELGAKVSTKFKDSKGKSESCILELVKSDTSEKKQVLRCDVNRKSYRITNQKHWDYIDQLIKANKGNADNANVPCDGRISGLFTSGNVPQGARDFWNDFVKVNKSRKTIVSACLPRA